MRLTFALSTATLLLVSGVAIATPPPGEEEFTLDLTVLPGGHMYFLDCSRGHSITDCGIVSIWQQSNDVPGLQTIVKPYGGQARPKDTQLLA